jgi:hypothetical protein
MVTHLLNPAAAKSRAADSTGVTPGKPGWKSHNDSKHVTKEGGKPMKRYMSFTLIFSALLAHAPYAAGIDRTCDAFYVIERTSAVYPPPAPPALGPETLTIQFGNFKARGSCGSTVPNRCRQRARDAAHQCMRTHWANPPDSDAWVCTDSAIMNYQIPRPNLRGEIQDYICRTFRVRNMTVRVKAVTKGDTDCSRTTVLEENFRVTCQ